MSYSFQIQTFYKTLIYTIILFMICLNVLYSQAGIIDIMPNGEFDKGSSGWYISRQGNSIADISLSTDSVLSGKNSLKINIISGGDSLADIRIKHSFYLYNGRYYKIYFMAAADRACNIQPVCNSSSSSANTIWRGTAATVTTKPQHFGPYVYRSQSPNAGRAFSFLVGGNDSTNIWIDSIAIEMSDDPENTSPTEALADSIKDILNGLIQTSGNEYLKLHFNSIINFIESQDNLMRYDYSPLRGFLKSLQDTTTVGNPKYLSSYLDRIHPFIIAWTSPTDGKVSFAQALPPKNWDPNKEYPLYVALHGLWNVCENPISYLSIYLTTESNINEPYEDGYEILPWGRGNLWYEGISETDVWESIAALESVVKVDQTRKYITGHSMGGYGAWKIALNSADTWAAIGIHAGALQYGSSPVVNSTAVQKLKNKPVYFVVGDEDGLMSINQTLYQMLQEAGDQNLSFNIFHGGHVYLYDNLKAMNDWLKKFNLNSQTDVEKNVNKVIPSEFLLYQNYPNPFNPGTVISYQLPVSSNVVLKIYDILGNEVSALVNEEKQPGYYQVKFDGTNLAAGIYIYKLSAGNFTAVKKLLLIK